MKKAKNEVYATSPISVYVSAEDVACAENVCKVDRASGKSKISGKQIARNCVLAQAFKRNPLFKNLKDIRVLQTSTKIKLDDGTVFAYQTPKNLKIILDKWDSGESWQGPVNEPVVFHPHQVKERTPEEKAERRARDLLRPPPNGKPKMMVSPRHVTPWGK